MKNNIELKLDEIINDNFYDSVNEALYQLVRTAFIKGYETAYNEIMSSKEK